MPPKSKNAGRKEIEQSTAMSSRKRNLETGHSSIELSKEFSAILSSTEKKSKDNDHQANLSTPEIKTNSSNSQNTSSTLESLDSISSVSVVSTISSSTPVTSSISRQNTRFSSNRKGSNKAHIVFSPKKNVYLQDSLDPVDESTLQINDEKVFKIINCYPSLSLNRNL